MRSCLVLAAVASLAIASARPASAEPRDTPKDGETAVWWALGTTTLGFATLAYASNAPNSTSSTPIQVVGLTGLAAFVVGPSAGHLYSGEYVRAGISTAVRGGALALAMTGVVRLTSSYDCFPGPCQLDELKRNARIMALTGAGLFVGSMLYDFIDAPRAARRRNRHAARPFVTASSDFAGAGVSGTW